MPFQNTTRHKPRRWPLALRFIKGAIHSKILIPVALHAMFAGLIAYMEINIDARIGLPPSIIPSLSIVVGLMLVFRNQTSYNRFWEGRNHLTVVITSVRNLTRMFLTTCFTWGADDSATRVADRHETEKVIKILVAILFATKNHLRADWGAEVGISYRPSTNKEILNPEYSDLLPEGLVGYDNKGLGIPLQFTFFVESYIKRGVELGWFHAAGAAQMSVQLNTMVDAYGRMETIRLTPIPVAHLIHQKQVLALFGMVLPFATVDEMKWWCIPVTTLVVFTLYGIDGIATKLEDPFGFDRIDIDMDAVVEDIRSEVLVLLDEWKRVGAKGDDKDAEWFVERDCEGPGNMRRVPQVRVDSYED